MAGIINQKSVSIDGVDDHIDCGSDTSLDNFWSGGASFQGWFRIESYSNNARFADKGAWRIYTSGDVSSNTRVFFRHEFSTLQGVWRSTSFNIPHDGSAWIHVRVEYDSDSDTNDPSIWINNVASTIFEVTTPSGTADSDASDSFLIGESSTSGNNLHAHVDEVSLWSKTGVTGLYNSGLPTDLSDHDDYDTYCISWYRMGDGDTYPTLTDSKGDNDATMVNMASDDIVDDVIVPYVLPDAVSMPFTVQEPTVAPGSVAVNPDTTALTFTVQQPTVALGNSVVSPDVVELSHTVEQPSVSTGSVTVSPDTTALTFTVQEPSVSVGDATVSPDSVSLSFTIQEPSVSTGSVTVNPDTTSLSFTVQEPSVSTGDLTVNPDSVSLSFTVEQPSVSTGSVTVTPDTVGLTFTVQEPTVSQSTDEQTVSPDIVPLVFTVQEPTVTTGSVTVSPNVVALTFTVQEPVITDGIAIVDSSTVIAITRPYTTELSITRPYTIDIEIT
jgi:hypothetical protein